MAMRSLTSTIMMRSCILARRRASFTLRDSPPISPILRRAGIASAAKAPRPSMALGFTSTAYFWRRRVGVLPRRRNRRIDMGALVGHGVIVGIPRSCASARGLFALSSLLKRFRWRRHPSRRRRNGLEEAVPDAPEAVADAEQAQRHDHHQALDEHRQPVRASMRGAHQWKWTSKW
jgi:hypothetical protein